MNFNHVSTLDPLTILSSEPVRLHFNMAATLENLGGGDAPEKSTVQSTAHSTSGTSNGEIQEPMTKRGLKSRHAQLIALGGSIGTALFVGSGVTLAKGGPAFMLIAYILMSGLVYMIV